MLQRLAIAGLDDERIGQFRGRGFTVLRGAFDGTSAGDHMDHYYTDKHKSFPPDIDREPAKSYAFRV